MNRRITSSEIARLAGVSRATVSYVLNGKTESERIPAITAEKIRKIARKYHYLPNVAARAMKNRRYNSLSLLLGSAPKGVWLPLGLLKNLQRETAAAGLQLNLSELPDDKLVAGDFAPSLLQELLADGILVNYIENAPIGLGKTLREYAIPHIWLNDNRTHNSVSPDDFQGGSKGIELLMEYGHRHIGYITHQGGKHYSIRERREGAMHSSRSKSVRLDEWGVDANTNRDELREQITKILSGSDRPTAFLAYSSTELQMVYAIGLRLGLRVPKDLSLMSFDVHAPPIGDLIQSSLIIPQNEIARSAVKMLMDKIVDPHTDIESVAVPYTKHAAGDTCAPPSSG